MNPEEKLLERLNAVRRELLSIERAIERIEAANSQARTGKKRNGHGKARTVGGASIFRG